MYNLSVMQMVVQFDCIHVYLFTHKKHIGHWLAAICYSDLLLSNLSCSNILVCILSYVQSNQFVCVIDILYCVRCLSMFQLYIFLFLIHSHYFT